MKKLIMTAAVALALMATPAAQAQKVVPIKFGNMDHWVTRVIKESGVIGGQTKHVYEIGPTQTINGAKAYTNLGGSPWGSSNVYAKVMGVVKTSNAVFPDTHGSGKCAKLTTMLEHVKAVGVINMDVLVSGSIFLGQMIEPLSSTKNPYSKMEMGIPYKQRPKYLQFDYKLNAPGGDRTYSSGFGSKKTVRGRDYAEVFIILQRRWEDSKGHLHAARVGIVGLLAVDQAHVALVTGMLGDVAIPDGDAMTGDPVGGVAEALTSGAHTCGMQVPLAVLPTALQDDEHLGVVAPANGLL